MSCVNMIISVWVEMSLTPVSDVDCRSSSTIWKLSLCTVLLLFGSHLLLLFASLNIGVQASIALRDRLLEPVGVSAPSSLLRGAPCANICSADGLSKIEPSLLRYTKTLC